MKSCSCCKIEKPLTDFHKQVRTLDGYRSACKSCRSIKSKEYREKQLLIDPNFKKEYLKEYYEKNKDKQREKQREYTATHKEERKKYLLENRDALKISASKTNKKYYQETLKDRLKTDPIFKLKSIIRRRILHVLEKKNFKKNERFKDYIGCTVEELVIHLESRFVDGMTWENHGQWHIDHIIPLDSAQSEEDIYKLNHYTNLQPLWAIDNLKKGSKI